MSELHGRHFMAQLRWVFSDWTESELEADGVDLNSTTPNNDGDDLESGETWMSRAMTQRLHSGVRTPIPEHTNISESRYSVRTASLERKDMNTKGLTQKEVTKTLLTTTRLSKESMEMRMQSVTSVMPTMKRMQTS